jgi:hypothetical protein
VITSFAMDPGSIVLVWIGVSILGLAASVVLAIQVLRTSRCTWRK